MKQTRYMVVDHPRESAEIMLVGSTIVGRVPVHHLLQNYHWHRLDDTHILLLGNFSEAYLHALKTHMLATVLPHTNSLKVLKEHCAEKPKHFQAIASALNLSDTATMAHFLDATEQHLGPAFSPSK